MDKNYRKLIIAIFIGAVIPSIICYYEQRQVDFLRTELKLQGIKMATLVAEQGLRQIIKHVDGTCICQKVDLIKHSPYATTAHKTSSVINFKSPKIQQNIPSTATNISDKSEPNSGTNASKNISDTGNGMSRFLRAYAPDPNGNHRLIQGALNQPKGKRILLPDKTEHIGDADGIDLEKYENIGKADKEPLASKTNR